MHEWVPLDAKAVPERPDRRTDEERKWNRFRFPLLVKEHGAATHIDFHPTEHYVAVACGLRIRCFDGQFPNADPIKTFSKFHGAAYGVSFRSDGRLVVAGGEEGRVRVYDEHSRSLMKQFVGHTGAVRLSRFTPDKVHIMSGGDDRSVRKWDLATETQIFSSRLHVDQVRCGFVLPSSPAVWITGGYDRQVLALDTRTQELSFSLSVADPVEQLLSLSNDASLAVASGSSVYIYDHRMLDRPRSVLSNHAKTVTALATSDGGSRLLTGSVDQSIKVWNADADFECLLTQRFSGPVLSVGMAPSNHFFVVGMADGLISMQHRPAPKTDAPAKEEARYQERRLRGIDHKPERGDFRVPTAPRVKRSRVDRLLRKFQYKEALDASLEERESAGLTVALISDLMDRRALDAALSGRDDESLIPIMDFLYGQITKPYYAEICIDVLDRIIELYSSVVSQSKRLAGSFHRVKRKLDDEIHLQMRYIELSGQVELTARN